MQLATASPFLIHPDEDVLLKNIPQQVCWRRITESSRTWAKSQHLPLGLFFFGWRKHTWKYSGTPPGTVLWVVLGEEACDTKLEVGVRCYPIVPTISPLSFPTARRWRRKYAR